MATKAVETIIPIKPIELLEVPIVIVGKTPLITHAWSEKAKQMILDTQTKAAKTQKHEIRIPYNDFIDSLNWLTEKPKHGTTNEEAKNNFEKAVKKGAHFGFHIGGIKQSFITGAYRSGLGVVQTELKGTFILRGAGEFSTFSYAEIKSPNPPNFREDTVNVGGMKKSADLRYRGEFVEWEIPLILQYNKNGKYSLEQLLNIINYGGFATGIGEWRPEKDGQNGMYYLKQM